MEATRSRHRSTPRRPPTGPRTRSQRRTRGQIRRARWGTAIAITVALGALIGFLISSGDFYRVIREITLPLRHEDIIRQQAAEKKVDASLIAAVIYSESRFRDQISRAGARGLMQITPATAGDIEKRSGGTTFQVSDLSDPQINISYGTYYLRELLDRYNGNEVAALAAYNAGPGNADSWGGSGMSIDDIPTSETRGYVAEVLDKQQAYRDSYAKDLGY